MDSTFTFEKHEFFRRMIEEMTKHDFRLMAWITMSNQHHAYYVDFYEHVRHTRLFFSLPGKTMLVMLEYIEGEGKENRHNCSYWHGWVQVNWNRMAEFRVFLDSPEYQRRRQDFDFDIEDFGFNLAQAIEEEGIFRLGWGSGERNGIMWNFDQSSIQVPIDIRLIARTFGKIKEGLLPYMYEQFNDLQITEFPPHYTFEGCEEWFWRQFPIKRLLTKVKGRIWGSDLPTPK